MGISNKDTLYGNNKKDYLVETSRGKCHCCKKNLVLFFSFLIDTKKKISTWNRSSSNHKMSLVLSFGNMKILFYHLKFYFIGKKSYAYKSQRSCFSFYFLIVEKWNLVFFWIFGECKLPSFHNLENKMFSWKIVIFLCYHSKIHFFFIIFYSFSQKQI